MRDTLAHGQHAVEPVELVELPGASCPQERACHLESGACSGNYGCKRGLETRRVVSRQLVNSAAQIAEYPSVCRQHPINRQVAHTGQ
jgi:hypothetical protein